MIDFARFVFSLGCRVQIEHIAASILQRRARAASARQAREAAHLRDTRQDGIVT
jgi:hypothetical protein